MNWEAEYWKLFEQYSLLWQYVAETIINPGTLKPAKATT